MTKVTKMIQSDATVACIINLCTEMGYKHNPGETVYKDLLTKDDKTFVANFVTKGCLDGSIMMSDRFTEKTKGDPKAVRRYVVGLVNDRLRKAKKLNGSTKYVAANPGKLKGSRDPEMKSLKQVLEITTDESNRKDIQLEIDRRQKELDLEKKKTVTIDVKFLSPELRKTLNL